MSAIVPQPIRDSKEAPRVSCDAEVRHGGRGARLDPRGPWRMRAGHGP